MTSAKHLEYRPDIDGLRAMAVLSVIGYHAFPGIVKGGFVGVDVFFVISGFLISGFILNGIRAKTFSFADFYARRIRRIFPALLLVLFATLAFGWIALSPAEYIELGKLTVASSAFVSNFALWGASGYFDIAAEFKPLLHLWSLGIEEQFYIIWPVLLLLLWKRTARREIAIVVLVFLSFSFNVFLMRTDPVATFFLPFSRFWELLFGALLAYRNLRATGSNATGRPTTAFAAILNGEILVVRNAASGLGLMLILGSVLLLRKDNPYPGWWALLPTAGTLLHIWAGPDVWLNRKLSAHPALVFVGLISYPLYLWHWPIISYIKILDFDWSVNAIRALKAGAVVVSGVVAWLTYQFVERPIRRAEYRQYVVPLCIAMGIVLVLGLVIVVEKGFVDRFSETERQVLKIANDAATGYNDNSGDGRCLLSRNQNHNDFSPKCFAKNGPDGTAGGILLWGDSEAAHFYPGIASYLHGTGVGFTQLTSNDCPALMEYTHAKYPSCPSTNKFVMGWAKQHRPRLVILAGYWFNYPNHTGIENTVRALKAAGIEKILIVGPVPEFRVYQPKLVVRAINGTSIPERLGTPFYERLSIIDRALMEIADRAGAAYESPLSLLCEADNCLVVAGGKVEGLMAWDMSHLTPFGSRFVVDRLFAKHLEKLRVKVAADVLPVQARSKLP